MFKTIRSLKLVLVAGLLALVAVPGWAAPPELVEGTLKVELSADGSLTFTWESTTASMSHIVYGTAPDAMDQQTSQYFSLDAFHRHVIEKVEPSTTYYYQIVIMNWTDEKTESEVLTFETPALESVDTVSGFGAISQVNLSWAPAFGAATYRIERSEAADGPYEIVGESETTSFSTRMSNLAFRTTIVSLQWPATVRRENLPRSLRSFPLRDRSAASKSSPPI